MKLLMHNTIKKADWWEEIEVKDVDKWCENQCYTMIEANKEALTEYYQKEPDKLRELFKCLNPELL